MTPDVRVEEPLSVTLGVAQVSEPEAVAVTVPGVVLTRYTLVEAVAVHPVAV